MDLSIRERIEISIRFSTSNGPQLVEKKVHERFSQAPPGFNQATTNYVSEIVSKHLTRFTEAQLDQIEAGKMTRTAVLEGAIHKLNETLF